MSLCNATIQKLEAKGYDCVTGFCPVPGCGLPVARHRDNSVPPHQAQAGSLFPPRKEFLCPPHETFHQVFVLGLSNGCSANMKLEYNDLLGTCFAVTKRHVLTAHLVLCEDDDPMLDEATGMTLNERTFVISRTGSKAGSMVSFPAPMEVKVVRSDVEHGWALLELVDASVITYFPAYFRLCPTTERPDYINTETVDLKAFVAPIGRFKRSRVRDLEIWSDDYHRVFQYDRDGKTRIVVQGGLYAGACGSPYVNYRGKVVALHLASEIGGENASLVKPPRKLVDQEAYIAAVYASIRIGVVLANVPRLMELVDEVNRTA